MYLPNLNGFRFVAAFMVIVCHLELFKARAGLENIWRNPIIFELGTAGVDFFFVLSGFLITYLLLQENQARNGISLKRFYVRRVLRIWPLYYLVLFCSFFLLPALQAFQIEGYSNEIHQAFPQKFLFSLFLMPNVALYFFGEMPYASPLWSVGVEEQFYLFWPLLLRATRFSVKAVILFIALMIGIKALFFLAGLSGIFTVDNYMQWKNLIVATRMECMGIGALGAFLHFKNNVLLRRFTTNIHTICAVLLVPVAMLAVNWVFEMHHIIYSLLFLIIIVNGATKRDTFIHMDENPWFSLGTISYGLYVWHPICIGASLWLTLNLNFWHQQPFLANLLYYSLAISFTLLISHLSYYYFEKFFLLLKRKATVIVSGNDAKNLQSGTITNYP